MARGCIRGMNGIGEVEWCVQAGADPRCLW